MKKLAALLLVFALLLALSACGTAGKTAESGYPFQTVTMIVPYGAGGTTDLVGRQLAAALGKAMGVTFVVDNQPGASGSLGCRAALRGYSCTQFVLCWKEQTLSTYLLSVIPRNSREKFP